MKTYDRVWFFCALLVVFMCVMLVAPAWAGGVTQSNDMNNQTSGDVDVSVGVQAGSTLNNNITTGGLTGGSQTSTTDVTVGGDSNRAYALSNSLGDVDIAGCLGSTQWNTPLFGKQKLVINWPCLAEFYLRNGLYENAAMAICNTEVRDEFDTEEDCRAAHPFKMLAEAAPLPESPDEDEEHDRFRSELADLTATVAALQHENQQLVSKVQKAEKTAQRASRAPQTDYERRRQAAKEILEGKQ